MGTPVDFWTLDDCVKALSDLDPTGGERSCPPPSERHHRPGTAMSGVPSSEDAIRQLLAEKERDLEMAAQIGKRLLEQNKDLESRLECLDDQLLSANDRAQQLKHELVQKEQLVQVYSRICEESQAEDVWGPQSNSSTPRVSPAHGPGGSPAISRRGTQLSSGLDILQKKIALLEQENNHLRLEHSSLLTKRGDDRKDRSIVEDCLKQLSEANKHIRNLSEELSHKTDKFMERQNEVSDLFQRSLEMEIRVKQLTEDNLLLNQRLSEAQSSQGKLTNHLVNIRDQYDECLKSLDEAHHEIRLVQTRQASLPASPGLKQRRSPPPGGRPVASFPAHPLSLAAELEASLEGAVEEDDDPELLCVSEPLRRCSYPCDAATGWRTGHCDDVRLSDGSSEGSGGSSEAEGGEECAGARRSGRSGGGRHRRRAKRLGPQHQLPGGGPMAARWRPSPASDKVQMVKSMEGSQTLRNWQRLARPSMSGALFERRPGVRVRGCSGSRNSGGIGGGGLAGLCSSSSSGSSSDGEMEVRFGLGQAGMHAYEAPEEPVRRQQILTRGDLPQEEKRRSRAEEAAVDAEIASLTFRMSSAPPDSERKLASLDRQQQQQQQQRKSPESAEPDPSLTASAPSLAALLCERGIRSKTYEELLGEGYPMPAAPTAACPATPRNSPTAELEAAEEAHGLASPPAGPVNPVLVFSGLLESLSDLFRPFGLSPTAAAPASEPGSFALRRNRSAGSGLEGLNAVMVPTRPPLPAVLHRTDSSAASPKRK